MQNSGKRKPGDSSRRQQRTSRALVGFVTGTTIGLAALPTQADEANECVSLQQEATKQSQHGHLIEAERTAEECDRVCPSVGDTRTTCATLLAQLGKDIPSVRFSAEDEAAKSLEILEVSMDGELLRLPSTISAIEVDPGKHEFRFSIRGYPDSIVEAEIRPGQRGQVVTAKFSQLGETRSSQRSIRLWPLLVGGAGLLLGGAAGGVAGSTLSSTEEFYDKCPLHGEVPVCDSQEALSAARDLRDSIRAREGTSIGLGALGGALLVSGIVGLAVDGSVESSTAILVFPTVDPITATMAVTLGGNF